MNKILISLMELEKTLKELKKISKYLENRESLKIRVIY